jgi:AMP-binding enzyme/Phosphopantetheine attachment site/AMP-binding enzyme C-terminal domain
MNLPAPYWREWVDSLEPGGGMTEELRLVITGSDRVDESRISRWFDRVGDRVRLIHAYGTTEATITSLTFEVTRDAWNPGAPLPVGRPLANVTAYVLDKFLAPVPAGVEGDIYLGGAGIARGYINHDSGSFVQSPFGEGRLYRTGDRAYTRRDGNVVFTGRADGQMKIRGFRVEPAEVEQALREIPGVRDAAVALGDDSRLTAWVIADRLVDSAEAIGLLRNVLPDYMVPAAVAQVPALPRTSGGKLDRKGLPALDGDGGAGNRAYTEPVSGPERTVARIWNEALLTRVGIDDNFFELGGHSLLLLRVHSKLEAALRREIPILELFRHPTVRSLAGFLKSGNLPSTMPAAVVSRARLRREAAERKGQPQT